MKRFTLLLCFASLLLVSCTDHPRYYKEEIEDAVRFQLSVANSLTVCDNVDDFLELCTWMVEMSDNQHRIHQSFRETLVEKSAEQPVVGRVLQLYDEMDVICSEPVPTLEANVWTFTEINSGVRFTFELFKTQDGDMYYRCVANDEDIEQITRQALGQIFLDMLEIDF